MKIRHCAQRCNLRARNGRHLKTHCRKTNVYSRCQLIVRDLPRAFMYSSNLSLVSSLYFLSKIRDMISAAFVYYVNDFETAVAAAPVEFICSSCRRSDGHWRVRVRVPRVFIVSVGTSHRLRVGRRSFLRAPGSVIAMLRRGREIIVAYVHRCIRVLAAVQLRPIDERAIAYTRSVHRSARDRQHGFRPVDHDDRARVPCIRYRECRRSWRTLTINALTYIKGC